MLNSNIGRETYIGFNAFLNGKSTAQIEIGEGCIIMPHTIIDSKVPIRIPDEHLVWGFIGSANDVENHSIPIDDFSAIRETFTIGKMTFTGMGSVFIDAFQKRIRKVLLANGALFANNENRGHAQDDQNISFNTIQPYTTGPHQGLYPSIRIKP